MKRHISLFFFSICLLSAVLADTPWTQRATMGGLGRHRAFSMSIGVRGYVGGGWNGNTMYFDFWEYDPGSNSWTQKSNIPTSMWSDPAFGIGNRGYVMEAGYTYMYNPAGNVWTIVNSSSPSATYYDQLKFVINGKGYLSDGTSVYAFDPSNNQWTFCANFPLTCYPELAFAANGKGYILDPYYNYFFRFDPTSNMINVMNSCPWSVSQGTSFGVNGKGYIGLGQDPMGDDVQLMYEFDPAANSWRGINKFEGAGRENSTAFVIGTKGYVTCGTSGINMNDLWEFDNSKITGTNELSDAVSLNIFPNPSIDGKFIVQQKGAHTASAVSVYDVKGNLVYDAQLSNGNGILDLSAFSNGNYSVSFFSAAGEIIGTRKIVMMK